MTLHHVLTVAALLCAAGAEPEQMTLTTIERGTSSQIEAPRTVVARTAGEWSKLWTEHGGDGKPPEVDFSGGMVIAVFAGTRSTAGYSVEITQIDKGEAGLVVTYRERGPGADEMVAQMLTSPFHIVRTAAHSGPVRFLAAR